MKSQDEAKVQLGDFRLLRRIGVGGMGIVYEANQVSLGRTVALKILGSALTEASDVARFRRAAQAAARLHHAGIAEIHYIGQDGGVCYMAMELIDGVPLHEVICGLARIAHPSTDIDRVIHGETLANEPEMPVRFDEPSERIDDLPTTEDNRPTDRTLTDAARQVVRSPGHIRRCCELIRDVAEALGYAHGQGVVHRDVKPGNIMVDRRGRVHVIDFGIARFFEDATITNTGQLVGTPMYMSPEQVAGRGAVDHRADQYSLGLVLYELLTLQPPLQAPTREELLRRVVLTPLVPVRSWNEAVPPSLENVVHKATTKDPEGRYKTIAEFRDDLTRVLDGKAVEAPPYRYKMDDREVASARPPWVVSVAVAHFFAAFLCCYFLITFLSMNGMGMLFGGSLLFVALRLAAAVIAIGLSVGFYCTAKALLSGRSWARWAAVATSGLATAVLAGGGVVLLIFKLIEFELFHFLLALGLIVLGALAFTAIKLLLGHPCRDWFRFAEKVRSEHAARR